MTQANESLGRTAADHIRALNDHTGTNIFDYALINQTPVSGHLQTKYALEGASQIVTDIGEIEKFGVTPVLGDYLEEAGVARHASARVAHDLLELHSRSRREKRDSAAARTV